MSTVAQAAARAEPPEPFENEIAAFEKADAEEAPPRDAVLFLGSSSIRLWSTLERDFPNFAVINRGFGGSTIDQSTLFAPRIVWPYQPCLILLYAGDNDLAEGKTPEQVLEDFQEFAAKVREKLPDTSIAFISIKPSPSRVALKAGAARANALIREHIEARRADKMRFIDVWTPMTDDTGNARPELFGPDDLHMNPLGYKLWKQLVAPHLDAILDEPAPADTKAKDAAEPQAK